MHKFLSIIATAVLLPTLCFGWGKEGHQVIATIAEDHLNETTKVMVQSLIGNNHLYSIAAWADDIRKERRATGPWHYVNISLGSKYDASRDCAPPRSCVVVEIEDFERVLTDREAPRADRAEALKFVVHFAGDIHQPLHAVKEAEGGNGVHVSFLGSDRCGPYECSLHGVWDTSMIMHTGLDRQEYASHLEKLVKTENLDRYDGGTPEQWANESVALVKAAWVPDGTNLDERYYNREIKVVDRQMALAGLRLARVLNETIGKMTPKDFAAAQLPSTSTEMPAESLQPIKANGGSKVWVNTRSGVYHCPGSRSYGNTRQGEYMTEPEAQGRGYRPASGKVCQ